MGQLCLGRMTMNDKTNVRIEPCKTILGNRNAYIGKEETKKISN